MNWTPSEAIDHRITERSKEAHARRKTEPGSSNLETPT
jgi:hypothetical protein